MERKDHRAVSACGEADDRAPTPVRNRAEVTVDVVHDVTRDRALGAGRSGEGARALARHSAARVWPTPALAWRRADCRCVFHRSFGAVRKRLVDGARTDRPAPGALRDSGASGATR